MRLDGQQAPSCSSYLVPSGRDRGSRDIRDDWKDAAQIPVLSTPDYGRALQGGVCCLNQGTPRRVASDAQAGWDFSGRSLRPAWPLLFSPSGNQQTPPMAIGTGGKYGDARSAANRLREIVEGVEKRHCRRSCRTLARQDRGNQTLTARPPARINSSMQLATHPATIHQHCVTMHVA